MRHASASKTLVAAILSIGFAGAAPAQAAGQSASDASQPADETASTAPHSPKSFPVPRSTISHRDREFVESAARSGIAEVELGKLAEQHAPAPR